MDCGRYREIIDALIAKKNGLIDAGHYTDAIDEILFKFSRAKQKEVKVVYTANNKILYMSQRSLLFTRKWALFCFLKVLKADSTRLYYNNGADCVAFAARDIGLTSMLLYPGGHAT